MVASLSSASACFSARLTSSCWPIIVWARSPALPTVRAASACASESSRCCSCRVQRACLISSGRLRRRSSMQASASSWSMTTVRVSGIWRLWAIRYSRRSTASWMFMLLLPCETLLERSDDVGWDEFREFSAEFGELLDQAGAEKQVAQAGRDEDGGDFGLEPAIHQCHLELTLEV